MRKKIFTLFAMLFIAITAHAQNRQVTGTVLDKESGEALMQTTVQVLKNDSSFVAGATTDEYGDFKVSLPTEGKYIIRMTNIGYKTEYKNITISGDKDVALGKINLSSDAVLLKEVVANGVAAKVTVKEDTFIYNAAAYRVPEGSVVEELVKKLPGAEVNDDGTIKINGKTVKKIMVDGKEFMTGDTQTAMKNLPTSIIERVKAYDQKSDLSRITGIDDGNETTVLDFGIKPGMNKGTLVNSDFGYGTKERYSSRIMGGHMKSAFRVFGFLNANNTGDMGFPGGGGGGRFGGGNNGLNSSKMGAMQLNYQGDKLIAEGSIRWNHRDGDAFSRSANESFVSQNSSFTNSESQRFSRSNSWNFQGRIEWKPDSLTNISFRPTYSYTSNDGADWSNSVTFNQDPYKYTTSPLDYVNGPLVVGNDTISVNSRASNGISYSNSQNGSAQLQVNRKLNDSGRNVTVRVDAGFSKGDSDNLSLSNVNQYLQMVLSGVDPTYYSYQTNRFNKTPTNSWNYTLQATYSEPLAKATFLQFNYQYKYSYSESDRRTYDFSGLGNYSFMNFGYRAYNDFLENNVYGKINWEPDTKLSKYSEYNTYTHVGEVILRVIREKYNFSAGVQFQPQRTHFVYDYMEKHYDNERNTMNISPTLDMRFKFSKVSQLRINYRSNTRQPSMTQLLDITDDSNPLNISKGNPNLKPEFQNSMRINYNGYRQFHMQSWMANLNFNTTRNSISNKVTYDEKTGGRTTMPENINGNWDISADAMFNSSIDTLGNWNVNTFASVRYNNYVGYLAPKGIETESQKNVTKSLTLSDRLSLSYRNSWLEVEPNANVSFSRARNDLQPNANNDTWQFNYGINVNITCPWGTSLSTDWHMNSRRGYSDSSMNTNESVWNAQISQSFLKGRPLTVALQLYDILHQQSNFSRAISAMQRSDTWYNSINSYGMLKVTYRFNAFGGKEARRGMGRRGEGFDGPPQDFRGGRGNFGGRGMGGFGGGGFGGRRGF